MMQFLEPPAQYDHPYRGPVIEKRLSQWDILKLCHGPTSACSWVKDGVCHVVLPLSEKDTRLLALMRRHEIGHCNGWPPDHRGGHQVEYDEGRGVRLPKTGTLKFELF